MGGGIWSMHFVGMLPLDSTDAWSLAVEDDGTGTGTPRGTGLGSRVVRAMATNLRSALTHVPRPPLLSGLTAALHSTA